jgi:hypothetical protein
MVFLYMVSGWENAQELETQPLRGAIVGSTQ